MREVATRYVIIPIKGQDDKPIINVDSFLKKAVEQGRIAYNDDFVIRVFKLGRLHEWYEVGDVYNSKGIQIVKKGRNL